MLFYAAVNVWGALVMLNLAKTGQVAYSLKYSPLRVIMFVTMQNLVSEKEGLYQSARFICFSIHSISKQATLRSL